MDAAKPPRQVKSCGFLVFRRHGDALQFLLMKHPNRYDLPKGHMEAGEDEMQTAMRELREETGLRAEDVQVESGFRFSEEYEANYRRFQGERVRKTLVVFVAVLRDAARPLRLTEHRDCQWLDWRPPHRIQRNTVDPLLAAVEKHWAATRAPHSA